MIILAAGQGTRLRPLTDERPKCLVPVAGRPILEWVLEAARASGITDFTLVGGYCMDALRPYGIEIIENADYLTTNMVHSLFCAERRFGDGFVLSYGDIVYSPAVLQRLMATPAEVGVVVDRDWRSYWELRFEDVAEDAESLNMDPGGAIVGIGQKGVPVDSIEAQYIGLMAFRGVGVDRLREGRAEAQRILGTGGRFGHATRFESMYMTDLLQGMADRGVRLDAVPIHGNWVEVDSFSDLVLAERLIAEGRLERPA